jgi:hypothetical protein
MSEHLALRGGTTVEPKAKTVIAIALVLVVLSACGEASASDAALQNNDVSGVSGSLHRCALSGSFDNAIAAIKKQGNPNGADSLQKMWSDLKAGGAQEGAYVAYATQDSDCGATSSHSAKTIYNIVIKFDSQEHAGTAYQSGALSGGGSPKAVESIGGQTGKQTGLGDMSWTVVVPSNGSFIAAWSINKYYSILTVAGGGILELKNLAGKVKSRQ